MQDGDVFLIALTAILLGAIIWLITIIMRHVPGDEDDK